MILVEGESDRLALEALARRRGRDLEAEGVSIHAIGGAHAIRREVERLHRRARLAGLCDLQEEGHFRKAFDAVGLARCVFVCERDLEDELIRALGVDTVEDVLAARHELGLFRSFQQQPAWRGRRPQEQLHRFFGTYSGRKIEIGAMLVDALDLDRVPPPLDGVLAAV
jgi:Overcoming lysogenization defect protein-like, TOPRIM domain